MSAVQDERHLMYASPNVREQSASVVQIESTKLLPVLVLLTLLTGVSIGIAAFAFAASGKSERETRMLEYYLLELDAKFINAGLKDPADSIAKKLKAEREKQ